RSTPEPNHRLTLRAWNGTCIVDRGLRPGRVSGPIFSTVQQEGGHSMYLNRTYALQGLIRAVLVMFGLAVLPATADAADDVTVMLRSGEMVSGQLEDLENGTLYVRVSRDDQRKLPV